MFITQTTHTIQRHTFPISGVLLSSLSSSYLLYL